MTLKMHHIHGSQVGGLFFTTIVIVYKALTLTITHLMLSVTMNTIVSVTAVGSGLLGMANYALLIYDRYNKKKKP